MILYINSCVREESRTDKIARKVLEKAGGKYEEIYLPGEGLESLSREKLEKRTFLIQKGDYSDPMFDYAKQFASADEIVISAPYWDLSFPSLLKIYIENIYVTGIVSEYDEKGMPRGLCRAGKLTYVTTSGGPLDERFGYEYIKEMASNFFGIEKTELIKAQMLDVEGFDAEGIIKEVMDSI